jgi:hypothetical protein
MCRFVTATLPTTAPIAALDTIARMHGRQFRPLTSPSVQTQLAAGEAYFLTTLGECDCGGPLGRGTASQTSNWDEKARKLALKGWSATKVARALGQQRERADAHAEDEARRVDEAMAGWVAFITGVLQSGHASELGLLIHQYSGPLDEEVTVRERRRVKVTAKLSDVLRDLDEDVLYLFHA